METKWRQFLKNMKAREKKFDVVLKMIGELLRPIWEAIVNGNKSFGEWDCCENSWL